MLRFPALWLVTVAVVTAAGLGALAAADRTPSPAFAQSTCSTDPFFSEYVEGTSNNKAVEIFNGADSPLDLSGYMIDIYSNGSLDPTSTIGPLSGSIAPGGVYVVAAQDIAGATEDLISAELNFNGNDAVRLRDVSLTLAVDVIGDIGIDPGVEWGVGPPETTQDNTLQRLSSVSVGRIPIGPPNFNGVLPLEWEGFAVDTFSGLGFHTADCFPGVPPPTNTPAPTSTPGSTGAVVTTIDAVEAPGPCLLLSTDSIDYGVLAFSTSLTSRSASGEVTVTTCNVEPEDVLARGADATGSSATWTLADPPGSGNMCEGVDGGVNRYAHTLNDGVAPELALSNTNQTYQSSAAADSVFVTATTFRMPCSSSDGAGELMSTSITFTAVASVP